MKLVYQYIAIFFTFSPTLNHLHPLQVENCGSNSRLVVDEDDNANSGLMDWDEDVWGGCIRLSCMDRSETVNRVVPSSKLQSINIFHKRNRKEHDDLRNENLPWMKRKRTMILSSSLSSSSSVASLFPALNLVSTYLARHKENKLAMICIMLKY